MSNSGHRRFIVLGFSCLSAIAMGQSTLAVGSAPGTPGGSVVLPLTLASSGSQPSGLQWAFSYSSDITGFTVTPGSSVTGSQKSISCTGNICLVWGTQRQPYFRRGFRDSKLSGFRKSVLIEHSYPNNKRRGKFRRNNDSFQRNRRGQLVCRCLSRL